MQLRAGRARTLITPPPGVELAGYGFGPSAGVLDDLEAQALYLERGDKATGLVATGIITADLLTFGPRVVAHVRARAARELGIPGAHVLLAASHSHSSPTAMPLRQWGRVDEAYIDILQERLVDALSAAQASACEAVLRIGQGALPHMAENRRAGHDTIDPAVPVLRFDGAAGAPRAVLFGYGCHPVSLHSYRNLISPDYPGYARAALREALGQGVVAMYALGAAGDVNPAGYVAGQTAPRRSRQIGRALGREVARVARAAQQQDDPALRVHQTRVDLPLAPLPPAPELEAAHAHWAARAAEQRAEEAPWARVSEAEIQRDWAADALRARAAGPLQQSVPCELQAFRLGDAALLALPLELFAETGLAIAARSPAAVTLISSNSNGGVGYLPIADAYRGRDYTNPQGLAPKVYGLYALAPGAEPLVRRAASQALAALFDPD